MRDLLFNKDRLLEMNSAIPIFKGQTGYTMKINIAKASNNVLYFFMEVMNNKNERVSLSKLDKVNVHFFVNEYRRFICGTNYKRSYSTISELRTLKNLILNREFSIFAFFSSATLPDFLAYNVFTFDTAHTECLANIIVRKWNMEYIFNSKYSDMQLWYLSTLNVDLVLRFLMHENEYSVQIIEKLLSYSRKMILSVIVILNVGLLYSGIFLKPDFSNLLWYFFWTGISVIGIPLSKWLPTRIFHFVVSRNINNLLGKKFTSKQEKQPK